MFKKFSDAYKVVSNLGQIQVVVTAAFVAIVKTADILAFILAQTSDTKLGKVVDEYLPPVITILDKVKGIILKYGKLVGFEGGIVASQGDNLLADLKDLDKSLDELLK
jgi:hypothetical protein